MKKRLIAVLVAIVIAFPMAGTSSARVIRSGAASSTAAPSYGNCTQLHHRWRYGVAKTRRAARRQVNSGHYRPTVSRAGYLANDQLDADNDLTACEVSL
jgi:Excalibur calcium-binding domain